MKEKKTQVLIIGSGPAGYTAAIYAARAGLKPLLVSGLQPGGQLMVTTDVENYPGFAAPIQGPWLMDQMRAQADHVGVEILSDTIERVDFGSRPFRCWGDSGTLYSGETVIIATGAQARWLGIPSESHFRGFGVSACATCDGFFFREKPVMVVGGGNTALEEALFLTNHASHVILVHRRDQFRGEKILHERVFKNPKISIIWDSVVEEIMGEENPTRVTSVRLRNVKTSQEFRVEVEGVFVAIGHSPTTSLFKGILDMDEEGYIISKPDRTATSIPGIFAAGDVQDKVYRQAVTAAGQGCMAALEVGRFLAGI